MTQAEFEKIEEEYKFWREYADSWESENDRPLSLPSRLIEVLALATEKYNKAKRLLSIH